MNTVYSFFVALFLATTIQAKTLTIEIPDDTFGGETAINGNFDGSLTVSNPTVFFNGSYARLQGRPETASAVCAFLNKTYVNFQPVSYNENHRLMVSLGKNGEIIGTSNASSINPSIALVICK